MCLWKQCSRRYTFVHYSIKSSLVCELVLVIRWHQLTEMFTLIFHLHYYPQLNLVFENGRFIDVKCSQNTYLLTDPSLDQQQICFIVLPCTNMMDSNYFESSTVQTYVIDEMVDALNGVYNANYSQDDRHRLHHPAIWWSRNTGQSIAFYMIQRSWKKNMLRGWNKN